MRTKIAMRWQRRRHTDKGSLREDVMKSWSRQYLTALEVPQWAPSTASIRETLLGEGRSSKAEALKCSALRSLWLSEPRASFYSGSLVLESLVFPKSWLSGG